jgi:hypothetical protein
MNMQLVSGNKNSIKNENSIKMSQHSENSENSENNQNNENSENIANLWYSSRTIKEEAKKCYKKMLRQIHVSAKTNERNESYDIPS